jgi:hypothetical protein
VYIEKIENNCKTRPVKLFCYRSNGGGAYFENIKHCCDTACAASGDMLNLPGKALPGETASLRSEPQRVQDSEIHKIFKSGILKAKAANNATKKSVTGQRLPVANGEVSWAGEHPKSNQPNAAYIICPVVPSRSNTDRDLLTIPTCHTQNKPERLQ